ncbi:uncharacterized protein [Antedon mediterranea]|uniref:uncharacterized protein n=1 Tax=Antedon mediterranea TaxID=105859 RepID=UPI003AF6AF7F
MADIECVWAEFSLKDGKWLCGIYYRPPGDANSAIHLEEVLLNLNIQQFKGVVLMGDFNINWLEAGCNPANQLLTKVSEWTSSLGLRQMIEEPTRIATSLDRNSTLIDLLFTNCDQQVCEIRVMEPFSTSDHCMISFRIRGEPRVMALPIRTKYLYNKTDIELLNNSVRRITWDSIYDDKSVNKTWEKFQSLFMDCINATIPNRRQKKKTKPWISPDIKRLVTLKRRLFKRAKSSGTVEHWNSYKKIRNKVKYDIGRCKSQFLNDLMSKPHNTKQFWSYVKSKRQSVQCSIFEVNAPGPDCLTSSMLKLCAASLSPLLTDIYNYSLSSGEVPSAWKDANIAPIHKKGKKGELKNYRPVALTSLFCKVLESIVADELRIHLNEFGLLYDAQHGFTPGKSCSSLLAEATTSWTTLLDKGFPRIDIVALDYSRAFDSISHSTMISKLKRTYGIGGSMLPWLESFLTGRKQQVVFNGKMSGKSCVRSGVPQGSVLGPLLFNIYVNDLHMHLHAKPYQYADDTCIAKCIMTEEDSLSLQQDIDTISWWSALNSLSLNPNKCQVLSLSRKRDPVVPSYNLNGHELMNVNDITLLGVAFGCSDF